MRLGWEYLLAITSNLADTCRNLGLRGRQPPPAKSRHWIVGESYLGNSDCFLTRKESLKIQHGFIQHLVPAEVPLWLVSSTVIFYENLGDG